MTEQEWLACTDPEIMLNFLRGKASERKLRLFMLNCCRSVWHLLEDKPYRHSVDIGERFVDGLASISELAEARGLAERAAWWRNSKGDLGPLWFAGWFQEWDWGVRACASDPDAVAVLALAVASENAQSAAEELCVPWATALGVNPVVMASILRDVCHAPYRGVVVRATWRTWNDGIIPKLAQAIYGDRAFDHLPILADALEESGCTNADILNHCRQPGEHVRGCWVVDLLLGKS